MTIHPKDELEDEQHQKKLDADIERRDNERIENRLKEPTMNIKDYLHLYLGCEVVYEGIINGSDLKKEKNEMDIEINNGNFSFTPKVLPIRGQKIGILKSIETDVNRKTIKSRIGRKGLQTHYGNGNFKLILRHLSDMTGEECKDVCNVLCKTERCYNNTLWMQRRLTNALPAELFTFLLSKHFDLFGLIDAGLAIDKNKIKML